jgi:hypothetical protein
MRLRFATVLAVPMAVGCGGGKKLALRYHPPAGAVYHYALEQNTKVSVHSGPLAGMGQQEMTMRMHFTQTVKGPAVGGGTEVQVVFDSTSMELPGMPSDAVAAQLARMRGLRSTVVFDDRAQVLHTDFEGGGSLSPAMANQMAAGIKAMTFGFPEQPVGQGDSWTMTTELPLGQIPGANASRAGPARTTLTVREIRVLGSDTSVMIDIKTAFPTGPIQLTFAGQQATLKLAGQLAGDQEFSISRGAVVNGAMAGSMTMSISAPAIGMASMEMATDTQNSIRLVDAK